MALGVLKRVFRQRRYAFFAAFIMVIVLSATLLLPHYNLIIQVLGSGAAFTTKLKFILSLYGSLNSQFSWFGALNVVLVSILFGINIALLTYYIRRRQHSAGKVRYELAGVSGFVSSLLGIGCAACGSVVITSVLGIFGAGGLLLLLPFHGAEFMVLGIVLLIVSIRYLVKRINDPLVCPLN